MTYRFYRTSVIGDGLSTKTAFRSKLSDYPIEYSAWINDAYPVQYCLANGDDTVHDQIDADAGITPISPRLTSFADLNMWIDTPIGTLAPAVVMGLEGDGLPVDWIDEQTTPRQLLRAVSKQHAIMQRLFGISDNALNFFKRNIDENVSSVPVAVRNRASAWITSRGLDASWITGSTKVREVINYVRQNLPEPVMSLGGIDL